MKNCSSEELAPLVAHLNPLAIPMGVLGPDDWLTHHPELGQVLAEFLRASCPLKAFGKTNVIYVYTTEELSPNFPTTLQKFLRFIESYFQLEVRRGREIRLSEFRADEQRGQRLRTEGFARILKEGKCHCGDGFGHVVLTTKDLFSIDEKGKHWPWVYGDSWFGSVSGGEAVISTNRYSEKAGDLANDTSIGLPELRRLLKVILHEIGHLFFILHHYCPVKVFQTTISAL